jgi:low affinity Fe/Cu permease
MQAAAAAAVVVGSMLRTVSAQCHKWRWRLYVSTATAVIDAVAVTTIQQCCSALLGVVRWQI